MKRLGNKILVFLNLKKAESIRSNSTYEPVKFGESKSVVFQMKGMSDTFCQVTEWANGEGFDVSIQTKQKYGWDEKQISLHSDELECLLAGLNFFNYFDYE